MPGVWSGLGDIGVVACCLASCLLPLELAVTVLLLSNLKAKDLARASCQSRLHSSSCAGRGRAPFYPLYFLPRSNGEECMPRRPWSLWKAPISNPSRAQFV